MTTAQTVRRNLALVAGAAVLFAVSYWIANHFPQAHAHDFYVAKAVIGIVAVLITVVHMDRTWDHLRSGAQMARYLVLLFGTVIAGAGSFEQIRESAAVELRNIGGAEFLLAVVVVMLYSLREDQRRPRNTASDAQNRR